MSQAFQNALIRKRWQAWTFIGAFGMLLLGFGVSNLVALWDDGLAKTRENGWDGFTTGKPMRALAEDLRNTPLAEWLGQRQREIAWLIFNDTGPRVRQGCPGWLFLMDELKLHHHAAQHARERQDIALRLHEALAARGSTLVIALVPDKTRIERDHLCDLPRPAALEARYDQWVRGLTAAGVTVVDLRAALTSVKQSQGAAFDRTDTHWNLAGAQAAANAVAAQLKALGFAPASPILIEYHPTAIRPRWGDLVRLAGLDKLPKAWRPAPDQIAEMHFSAHAPKATEQGAEALFGDVAEQRVALVGTSFSRNAHFADFLAAALASDVGNFAREGGGFAQSMLAFLEQEAQTATPTPWIVWEIPERILQEPLEDTDRALLAGQLIASARPTISPKTPPAQGCETGASKHAPWSRSTADDSDSCKRPTDHASED
ncbi:MAG: hypothetical protein ABWU16_03915 [Halothiobacillaceae bacterium]